ncbi:Fic family protein [Candidatus Gottesmanbacteria bacterium]|nr:Fic family protein [Candidatus Gottesmanbacteria bacterium]
MNETKNGERKNRIILYLSTLESATSLQIAGFVSTIYKVSKPTLARDLQDLVKDNQVEVLGNGRAIKYRLKSAHPLLRHVSIDAYFIDEPDKRVWVQKNFNKDIFNRLPALFSKEEISDINKIYKPLPKNPNPRELERFVIELSWKSSKIEGNTYSLLETETLIKQSIEAHGHSKEEAIMILNHKRSFEQILQHKEEFKTLHISTVLQLHNTMVDKLNVKSGIRKIKVGISGSTYVPIDNQWQLRENLDKLLSYVNSLEFILEKALVTTAMVAYLQCFADGNKRTSRMLANAVLISHDWYPLSYRNVDIDEYKKALIIFYETNNMLPFKKLIVDQYRFALETYYL